MAADERYGKVDWGRAPKIFRSLHEAHVEISGRRLQGFALQMVILKFGVDETQWKAWLDGKDTYIEKR